MSSTDFDISKKNIVKFPNIPEIEHKYILYMVTISWAQVHISWGQHT